MLLPQLKGNVPELTPKFGQMTLNVSYVRLAAKLRGDGRKIGSSFPLIYYV